MSIMDTNQDITQEQHDAIVDRLHFPREEGWEHGIRHFADLTPSDLDAIRAIAPGFVDDEPWNDFEGTKWLQQQLADCGISRSRSIRTRRALRSSSGGIDYERRIQRLVKP